MIIRSGLIRNRDGIDFARFTEHWRTVHGPLALRVAGMVAYTQNHIVERLHENPEGPLHRVDGISQLYFDDVESMRDAMESAEQKACIEDIRGFLSDVTLLIQRQGELRWLGAPRATDTKLIYLLSGEADRIGRSIEALCARLSSSRAAGAVRYNPVVDRTFAVDSSVPAGAQAVDGVFEAWLPADAAGKLSERGLDDDEVEIVAAFRVAEYVLSSGPGAHNRVAEGA